MEKTLQLALNKVDPVPNTLRSIPSQNIPRPDLPVNLASLYHHYYLDSYERTPPNPDPAQFEYLPFISATKDFRLSGDGLGAHTAKRRSNSTSLGQAFCRMTLHDHFGISYFAHMDSVLNRPLHRAFSSIQVERIASGDAPDYFCAQSTDKIFLSEAKGRYASISFGSKEFTTWRSQFTRVAVREQGGGFRKVKGYIVATRFATEQQPGVASRILIEDPESPGQEFLSEDQTGELGEAIISLHYSDIALKLGQPILASALAMGYQIPEDIRIPFIVWRVTVGPQQGRLFVGGYYPGIGGTQPFQATKEGVAFQPFAPFRLDIGTATFVGVELDILRSVVKMARVGPRAARGIEHLAEELIQPFYSGVSLLRDGSVIGPIEFFSPIGQQTL
jgi:hypothetical protein